MIITQISSLPTSETSRYCWSGLQRFQNVAYVEKLLNDLHQPPKRQGQNVRKQAEQIRYCLTQAREYKDAARVVTMATRPLLYYYSIMSLALAEILLKQNGESSLDVAREQHRHHGLELRIKAKGNPSLAIADAASQLVAAPLLKQSNGIDCGFGTFELWHRSMRHMPILGRRESRHADHTEALDRIIFTSDDIRSPLLPSAGISLLECLMNIPAMKDFLASRDVQTLFANGQVSESATDHPEQTI